jgi:hypothetical protein
LGEERKWQQLKSRVASSQVWKIFFFIPCINAYPNNEEYILEEYEMLDVRKSKIDEKMSEINASMITEQRVLEIIKICLKSLTETYKMWKNLIDFFTNIGERIEHVTEKVGLLF